MSFSSDVVTIERDGPVGVLWLDRPDARNAMGTAFFADLPRAMAELGSDSDVRAVIMAAKGPHFTVGLDLKEMGGLLSGGDEGSGSSGGSSPAARNVQGLRAVRRLQAAITAVEDCPVPVIAACHGYVIGGGIDLITACDIRLASADAVFSVRETKVAIVADLGTLQRLPRIVSPGHVAELAYTGRDIDADRAARIGLVNDVHADPEAVLKAARGLAAEIAANSPLVVRGVKEVLRAGRDLTVQQGLEHVAVWNSAFLQSNDLVEAMTAFMEKREPHFKGE